MPIAPSSYDLHSTAISLSTLHPKSSHGRASYCNNSQPGTPQPSTPDPKSQTLKLDALQGRASYYNYGWSSDNPEAKDPKLEKNRPALQSIHLDKAPYLGAPAWSAHVCGALAPEYACAVIRSNLWPGACTVAQGCVPR